MGGPIPAGVVPVRRRRFPRPGDSGSASPSAGLVPAAAVAIVADSLRTSVGAGFSSSARLGTKAHRPGGGETMSSLKRMCTRTGSPRGWVDGLRVLLLHSSRCGRRCARVRAFRRSESTSLGRSPERRIHVPHQAHPVVGPTSAVEDHPRARGNGEACEQPPAQPAVAPLPLLEVLRRFGQTHQGGLLRFIQGVEILSGRGGGHPRF